MFVLLNNLWKQKYIFQIILMNIKLKGTAFFVAAFDQNNASFLNKTINLFKIFLTANIWMVA